MAKPTSKRNICAIIILALAVLNLPSCGFLTAPVSLGVAGLTGGAAKVVNIGLLGGGKAAEFIRENGSRKGCPPSQRSRCRGAAVDVAAIID